MAVNTNTNEVKLPVWKVNELLTLHDASEKRLERAMAKGSKYEDVYRADCLAIEIVLNALGIDWDE